jgi:two-component system LytT family response regulator
MNPDTMEIITGTAGKNKSVSMKKEVALKALIIEDELPAYNRLSKLLPQATTQTITILDHLDSVKAAAKWFSENDPPDIAFVDIHLADGSAFDLLKSTKIDCPLIFTTAYDQYSMEAFKTNGIDYLLKPIKKVELQRALQKLQHLTTMLSQKESIEKLLSHEAEYKRRFIIRYGENIKTISAEEIAYCFSANKATCVCTFSGRTYPIDHNLDQLENMLNPIDFFRVNRQYIIHVHSIDEMKTYSKGRVFLTLKQLEKESLVVSSEKSAKFKRWLAGEF